MDKKEFTGKTVEEAVQIGLTELGITKEDAEITILDEGKKKLFGSVPAKVLIGKKEKLTDGQRAVKFLEGLLPHLDVAAIPALVEENEKILINLDTESTKGIIGRRGEIIDAVQVLVGAVANTGRRDYKRVVVDCGNYREDREETLKRVAEKLAAKAVRIGKRVRLEPMNPYERRIIHSALADSEEVTTKSEGKEPARYVVITPKNLRNEKNRSGDRDRRKGNGKGGNRDRKYDKYGDKKPYPKRELPAEETPQSSGTSLSRGSSDSGFKKGGFSGFFGTYLGKDEEETVSEPTTTTETNDTEE